MGMMSSLRNHGYNGDYFTDRLVRIYSPWIFVILAVVIAVAMTGSGAITCWVPTHFTTSSHMYTEEICLNTATLWRDIDDYIPRIIPAQDDVPTVNMSRFRSFPIMLFFQALLFLLPWLLWKLVSGGACNLDAMIREASRIPTANATGGVRSSIGGHLQKLVCNPCSILGSAAGGYVLSLTYLFIKFFLWVICFVQMAVIGAYFNIRFFTFKAGQPLWDSYSRLEINGNTSEVVVPFPRKIMCDFQVRRLGNIQRYSVECMLGFSETLENSLTVIWIWLILLLVILAISGSAQFLHTILRCVRPMAYTKRFLKQRLIGVQSFNMASTEVIQKFSQMYLKPDMFFVIGMIEENGSISAATLGLIELWEEFLNSSKIHVEDERRPAEEIKPQVGYHGSAGLSTQAAPPPASQGPYSGLQHQLQEAEQKM